MEEFVMHEREGEWEGREKVKQRKRILAHGGNWQREKRQNKKEKKKMRN